MRTKRIDFRGITAIGLAFSFTTLAVSGLVLFLSPRGWVAARSGWSPLGMDKEQWVALHLCAALLVLVVAAIHIVFNWRPLLLHLRGRVREGFRVRREAVAAAVLVAGVCAGAVMGVPPLDRILGLRYALRDAAQSDVDVGASGNVADVVEAQGRPQWGRMTVSALCGESGVPVDEALRRLEAMGISARSDDPLSVLSQRSGRSAREIALAIQGR